MEHDCTKKSNVNLVETNDGPDEAEQEINAINQRQFRKQGDRRQISVRDAQEDQRYWLNVKTRKICYVSETKLPPLTEEQMRSWKAIPNKAFVALTPRIGGNKHNRRNLRQRNVVEKAYRKVETCVLDKNNTARLKYTARM